MVSYQAWTSIAFEVARRKGVQFEDLDRSARFVREVVSELWRQDKERLKTATRAEARDYAEKRISR